MTLPDSALRRARSPATPTLDLVPTANGMATARPPAAAPALPAWWPSCAVCRGPVELLAWSAAEDPASMVLVARCHGARQQWTLPRAAALQGALPPAPLFVESS